MEYLLPLESTLRELCGLLRVQSLLKCEGFITDSGIEIRVLEVDFPCPAATSMCTRTASSSFLDHLANVNISLSVAALHSARPKGAVKPH